MINNPFQGSTANQPRGAVYANGERVAGLISFSVDNNTFFQADSFRLSLSMSAQPDNRGFDWWAQQEKLELEFLIGFPNDPDNFSKADLTSYLVGYADDLEFDQISDTMTMNGRDLTSTLIDYKNSMYSKVSGRVIASDIVTAFAIDRGLTPVVTATSFAQGGYYQIVHALITSSATYWDIITRLAQLEGFQTYVKGHELHFEPRTSPDDNPYVIQWQKPDMENGYPSANVTHLRFTRNLSIAKDLRVRILSYDLKTNSTVNEVADRPRTAGKNSSAIKFSGGPQEYVFNVKAISSADARKLAQKKLIELSQHEMNLSAELPGDVVLSGQNIIRILGTGTAFDQTYYPSSISRTYSVTDGFRMAIQAKNQTPNNPS